MIRPCFIRYNIQMKKTQKQQKQDKKQTKSLVSPNSTVTIKLSAKETQENYKKILKVQAKLISISGFRKGKVPPKIAEEKIGQSKLIEEVLRALLPEAYQKAVAQTKKQPLTSPEFQVKTVELGKDWEIEAHFAQAPEVKLGDYKKSVKTAKKEADKQIKKLNQEAVDTKTKAKKIDSEKKAGEEKTPPVQELNDRQKQELTLQQIFKALATEIKPAIPELLLRNETQREFQNLASSLERFNLKLESYLERRKITQEQLSNELATQTLGRLQLDFILGTIAKEEKLSASPEEIKKQIAAIKDEKTRKTATEDPNYQRHIETEIIRQKTVDYLLSI